MDERVEKLAKNIIEKSVELKPKEKILISVFGANVPLAKELVKYANKIGAEPFLEIIDEEVLQVLLQNADIEHMKLLAKHDLEKMKDMDSYISISAVESTTELVGVPDRAMKIYEEYYVKPVHLEQRVKNTKWCILRYPTKSMAKGAKMSFEEFEDFYFKVCSIDYDELSKKMDKLVELMERTDNVRIVGNGTDLSFSIKGMPAIKCDGKNNLPDGEVYTAPVIDSINGKISYNIPSEYNGFLFNNIRFEFKDGKIVRESANDMIKLSDLLNTDKGARYIGEFALGLNPYIKKSLGDSLFDEKICGSFHLTPGACYDDCNNGNASVIHWDLVQIQTEEYGGGEIWFDDVLIRKDGLFVPEELQGLNP